jgi:hypothetical protein
MRSILKSKKSEDFILKGNAVNVMEQHKKVGICKLASQRCKEFLHRKNLVAASWSLQVQKNLRYSRGLFVNRVLLS